MNDYYKRAGGIFLLMGAMSLVGAVVLRIAISVALATGHDHDLEFLYYFDVQKFTNLIFVLFLLLITLPTFIGGAGMLLEKPWARKLGFILGIIYLFFFPLGTLLAIICLILLAQGVEEQSSEAHQHHKI